MLRCVTLQRDYEKRESLPAGATMKVVEALMSYLLSAGWPHWQPGDVCAKAALARQSGLTPCR